MASLISALNAVDAPQIPYVNTNTIIDLATGGYIPGVDGCWILNGGLAPTNGVSGRPKSYKSTLLTGAMINACAHYKDSESFVFDSENSLKKPRLIDMHNRYRDDPDARAAFNQELDEKRVRLYNESHETINDLESFFNFIKQIAEHKIKNRKDYIRESPILDPRTGKPVMVWVPTFVAIDSLTMAKVKAVEENAAKFDFSDSKNNTYSMSTGRVKANIVGQLTGLAGRAGIYFCLTAQIGNTGPDMSGGYGPPPKEMQYMKQGDKLKGVSPNFDVAISNLFEARVQPPLLNSDRTETKYPYADGLTMMNEMTQLDIVLVSCKNNPAGCRLRPITSQTNGPEVELTYFDYLKEYEFGLVNREGKPAAKAEQNPRLAFFPDIPINRRQATTKLLDYKMARAAQILGELAWLQKNWTVRSADLPLGIDAMTLVEKLDKAGYARDDVLNSRGYWTYDKEDPRPYLSLFDILAIANDTYKPKLHQVGGPTPADKKKAA